MNPTIAVVLLLVAIALVLWAVFGADPAEAIYGEDDETGDDEMPPDARRWRDPWGEP